MRYFNTSGPCNPAEHYTVVFSRKHSEDDVLEQEETINGKRIFTRLIRVNFDRPSRKSKRKKPKLMKTKSKTVERG